MARFSDDPGILQAALIGFEVQKQKIEAKISELKAQLRGKPAASAPSTPTPAHSKKGGKRVLSDAARERIAAAQRKRWAEFHKQKGAE